jgi:hypothetical protein
MFNTRQLLAALLTTLAAWLAAFLVVLMLLTVLGDELGSLPLALRALVMSGVIVGLMVNLVMPIVGAAIPRLVDSERNRRRLDERRPRAERASDAPSRSAPETAGSCSACVVAADHWSGCAGDRSVRSSFSPRGSEF